MKYLFIFLFFCFSSLEALTLKEKIQHGSPGDYVVTEQGKTYSLLTIRSLTDSTLVLEEISVPENGIDLSKILWKKWIEDSAPGHTSWIAYEIDLKDTILKECYSYTRKGWLYVDESEYFFGKLLTLPLAKAKPGERRKIGPPPAPEEEDHRSLWTPPLIIEGKKNQKPHFEVWKGTWPLDKTELSGSEIEVYFDAGHSHFPFPFWIEFKETHYALKIRAIDSGSGLSSPMESVPRRQARIVGQMKKINQTYQISLKSPSYYKGFSLFAVDHSGSLRSSIPIPCRIEKGEDKEDVCLKISAKDLQSLLTDGHSYHWAVMPEDKIELYTETEEPFVWHLKE